MTPGPLPESSITRLAELASRSAGIPGAPPLQLSVVAVAADWLGGVAVCPDIANPPLPLTPDPAVRAWVLLPVQAMDAPRADDDAGAEGLALLVGSAAPRAWSDGDVAALSLVAATAATEIRLRAGAGGGAGGGAVSAAQPGDSALHDALTDLPSRQLFLDRVAMACLRHARYANQHFAVLSLSIEQFHGIESTFGYDAARELLREFGRRLTHVLRNYDSVARLDGDEFGILLESIRDESDAARVANRVHDALRVPIETRMDQFRVTANVGIVLSFSGIDSAERLTQLATLARGRARETRAAYEIFDPIMQQHARARLSKEMDLRRAVEAGEFELHYQPIVSMATGRIASAEGLIRWRHPRQGVVSAAQFITLAEETGLAVPLGWLTISQACAQLNSWRQRPGHDQLGISVNVTAAHFRQRDMTDTVADILRAQHVSGGLSLEITEHMLIGNVAEATAVLNELRGLGLAIHLDDFGTGYSSLQYLHELPFDAIKIDRGFIARMRKGGREAQVAFTIRELARQLGVPVIAEGVETPEHLGFVRDLGCEFAQGYFFARPVPPSEMEEMLVTGPHW